MKFSALSLTLFLGSLLQSEGASFARDVMGLRKPSSARQGLDEQLLEKAVPLDEYEKKLNAEGLSLGDVNVRRVEGNNYDDQQVYENEDDYFLNEMNYLNLTGYSFKYAKCQPVQRFSQDAVEAGEYSPMVVNDIVILRLCDSSYCSDKRAYGCTTGFVEYAIELTDYIRVMMRYKMDKKEQLCDWCNVCSNMQGRRRDTSKYYYYTFDEDGNLAVDEQYVDDDDFYSSYDCTEFTSTCFNDYGYPICDDDNNNYNDDGGYYMTDEGYLDIIGCTQVNGGYFLRPRCDTSNEILTMGVFHDKFCTHYAGDEIGIENFNLGINYTYFEEFGKSAGCQDCSETNAPPYFNSNSNLCNRLNIESARCTSSKSDTIFVTNSSSSYINTMQCSFIDTVRFGTYDSQGRLYSDLSFRNSMRRVTTTQKILLALSMITCGFLAIYSCYLHHSITNLLIKSLSHTDLLPPSKYRRRANSGSRRRGGSGGRRPRKREDEEDKKFLAKGDGDYVEL